MIGLGNLQNGDFVAHTVNGVAMPVYASPYTVGYGLAHLPSPTPTNHSTLTNNPHQDTAESIGLGNLLNVGMYTDYTLGQAQYSMIFSGSAATKYISPYVVVQAVSEAEAAQINSNLTLQVQNVTKAGGSIDQANAANATANVAITNAQAALNQTTAAVQTAQTALTNAQNANTRFSIVSYNAAYAAMCTSLLNYYFSNPADAGSQLGSDNCWPLPSFIENLYFWADVNYAKNTFATDSSGNTRLMALIDRSSNSRLFVANSQTYSSSIPSNLVLAYNSVPSTSGVTNPAGTTLS